MAEAKTPPVESLSDDILIAIFLHFPAAISVSWRREASYEGYEWMSITHVCRHWRSVSLGCPLIWTTINLEGSGGLAWVSAFLERAQHAPLDIAIDWKTETLNRLETIPVGMLDHLHHTRRLSLVRAPGESMRTAVAEPGGSFPDPIPSR